MLVYDYRDLLVPMLARMYKKRLADYSALGYTAAGTSLILLGPALATNSLFRGAGEAYDARDRGPNRKFRFN